VRRKRGTTVQVIRYLAVHGSFPGKTRGEIQAGLNLPAAKEVTARVREARDSETYGKFHIIRRRESQTEHRYWMPVAERRRAIAWLRENAA
jgi:hypothetical protein